MRSQNKLAIEGRKEQEKNSKKPQRTNLEYGQEHIQLEINQSINQWKENYAVFWFSSIIIPPTFGLKPLLICKSLFDLL